MPTPIAAYNFDEASGSVLDASGNGNNFSVSGDASRTVSGHTNGGLAFAGAGGAGLTVKSPALGQTTDRTVMAWLKFDSSPGTRWAAFWEVVSIGSGSWGILLLSGTLHIQARNASTFARASVAAPTNAGWHHVAGTYVQSTGTITIYLDGTSSGTASLTGPLRTDADNLILGSADGEPFSIDDFRIYSSALTGGEITTAMNTPVVATTPVTSDLDARWAVKNRVNSDADLRWAVKGVATSDLDVRWAVKNRASSDLDARWAVRSAASSDLDARWAVRSIATSDADLRWAVRNSVSGDLDLRWAVRSVAMSDLDARWAVRGRTTSDLDTRWIVRNLTSSDLDLRWAVNGVVSSDLDARWAVRSTVVSDLELRWAICLALTSDVDLRWAVLSQAAVTSDLTLMWIVRHRVSSDLALVWLVTGGRDEVTLAEQGRLAGLLNQQGRVTAVLAQPRILSTLGAQDG